MHERFMKKAILAAEKGRGKTFTNPLVGAVIVKGNQVLAVGAHLAYGDAHAEKVAIDYLCDTPEKLLNSTIYVTLEPCDHHGKQPPCTEAIIAAGIRQVVVGQVDPNPIVSGQGIKKLRDHGIHVLVGVLEEEVRNLNRHYNYFFEKKRPFVALKQAISLDGKLALLNQRTRLTSEYVVQKVREERANYQAILVGSQTILTDNPKLTSAINDFPFYRVILDRRGRVFEHENLAVFQDETAPVLIFTEQSEICRTLPKHVEVIYLPKVLISEVLTKLGERLIQSVYVEGGAKIHDAFLASACWEELITYVAPKILGGDSVASMSSSRHVEKVTELNNVTVQALDNTIKIVGSRV
ncbi:bifunctional diaminohydroxyphosphoribosylaminopyrimidine deaminase/5-amino-6-(5-phosphoribosylamino)uracil reductase RibD [Enterococcus thailandicus]|uniref:bifunctional diaminohydroxyphosphoribosylaminopyrimidine deaminase/5-amino-6-(5-phosphoribosylamino)uracil reductase RibD n=1 Tax=Enterococcus TaxID=1350 RepID=UPI0022E1FBBF|nr:bifunctional diaminohydroxyphosphoribosylaminopyrimidine deaminase/5-amino-6-(5-phosphoribosylamino)uracil reductase RibD [Enterococcus thailandicus]MDT2751554.1 bifunctional diaminohydroxyphosphoribosylaminopyrimidine deaminase/5-amino-6-(5-phosphoribosylamino)uracil reductase RibD [Enterococcus thailandicus]MDT2776338.1 bifunctional diaminohydroxyphosphoribosylaminopyrimidine deaminase/5-amino-6-(5-phosphoribosylamino)uracil reductase RibD [Enterococcus thailandicus]MDT2794953.1 bifunctiona